MTSQFLKKATAILFIIIIYIDKRNGFFKDQFTNIDPNQPLFDNIGRDERTADLLDKISELL